MEYQSTNQNIVNAHRASSLLDELQSILQRYLDEKKNLTLNGLSKKCRVSEPTLRRIVKGQVKTVPNVTTVLDILSTVSGEKSPLAIAVKYPGPINDFLRKMIPQIEESKTDFDPGLNAEFRNPTKYLVYKLASNAGGVSEEKISTLFGNQGMVQLKALMDEGHLKIENGVYFAASKNFMGNQKDFVPNFKVMADFIKMNRTYGATNLNPVCANFSDSVSLDAYKKIATIQKNALMKIRAVMTDEKSAGPVPIFLLLAIDTLDSLAAYEMAEEFNKH